MPKPKGWVVDTWALGHLEKNLGVGEDFLQHWVLVRHLLGTSTDSSISDTRNSLFWAGQKLHLRGHRVQAIPAHSS